MQKRPTDMQKRPTKDLMAGRDHHTDRQTHTQIVCISGTGCLRDRGGGILYICIYSFAGLSWTPAIPACGVLQRLFLSEHTYSKYEDTQINQFRESIVTHITALNVFCVCARV